MPSLYHPLPPSLFQLNSSFHLYHETFFRNFFGQYFPSITTIPLSPLLLTPSNTNSHPVSIANEVHPSIKIEHYVPKTSSSKDSSRSKIRRRLSCPQCSYTTNRLNNLKRHIQTMHEILSEPIDCCDQLFISKANFRAHVNTEHRCGYHCDTCQRTFCRKALLKRHQSIHSGQKAFFCSLCSYSTSHKGNLDRHTRIHQHSNGQQKDVLT